MFEEILKLKESDKNSQKCVKNQPIIEGNINKKFGQKYQYFQNNSSRNKKNFNNNKFDPNLAKNRRNNQNLFNNRNNRNNWNNRNNSYNNKNNVNFMRNKYYYNRNIPHKMQNENQFNYQNQLNPRFSENLYQNNHHNYNSNYQQMVPVLSYDNIPQSQYTQPFLGIVHPNYIQNR